MTNHVAFDVSWARRVLMVAVPFVTFNAATALAQTRFLEVGAGRGLGAYAMAPLMGGGIAAEDYDGDGDVDLFIPNAEAVPDQLYRNLGNGHFEEIAGQVGLASTLRSRSALWFDADGDGDFDLLVAGDCFGTLLPCEAGVSLLRLYRQEVGGGFLDVTAASGLWDDAGGHLVNEHRGGLAAGDLDRDGDLDLYVAMWNGIARLWWNNGSGIFTASPLDSGRGETVLLGHWQPVIHDYNNDGWPDIFVSIDFDPNQLWINQHNGTFVDMAATAGVNTAWNEMGVALGDFDNNGRADLYSTNVYELEPDEQNVLFRATGPLSFEEEAVACGVENTGWGWGTTFIDADRDGDLDLAATNGFTSAPHTTDPSRLFRNDGGSPVQFTDISTAAGFDDTLWGSSLVAVDFDRDGDLDLAQTAKEHPGDGHLRLLDNVSRNRHHYLVVDPTMPAGNRHAIGTVVRVETAAGSQMRVITAGISFLGQEPSEAFFGLGDSLHAREVTVEWPDGRETRLGHVAADQRLGVSWITVFADGFEGGDFGAWSLVVTTRVQFTEPARSHPPREP